MKKNRIIILGVLILCLILTVSLVLINSFEKQKSDDAPIETVDDTLQNEELADTEVEFTETEPNNQQNQEDTTAFGGVQDSSDTQEDSTSTKQENSKDSQQVEDSNNTKNPEEEKEPDETMNPEEEKQPENSDKEEQWTGYY